MERSFDGERSSEIKNYTDKLVKLLIYNLIKTVPVSRYCD